MSLTLRKAASSLGAAALGVTALTGVSLGSQFDRPGQCGAQLF